MIDSKTSDVELSGDAYPAFQVYRYSANGSVQALLESSDSRFHGMASCPQFPDRYEHWMNGVRMGAVHGVLTDGRMS
ncbi:hypothetical protein ACFVWG_25620 [Kribbella sp. NPDC058245]|uniref:hypothetical protein n=1 Tax=Kribbella sp. NPDC058245 TaxID=3346399 RepID=UPI0036EBFCDC